MPMIGLGVYNIPERETQRVVEDAVSVGYRSIDTAAMYHNEKGVGDAVRACGLPREELFITTKICDSCYTKEETLRTARHSMKQLGLDYVDLMLIRESMRDSCALSAAEDDGIPQTVQCSIGSMESSGRGKTRHLQEQDADEYWREIRQDIRTGSLEVPDPKRHNNYTQNNP